MTPTDPDVRDANSAALALPETRAGGLVLEVPQPEEAPTPPAPDEPAPPIDPDPGTPVTTSRGRACISPHSRRAGELTVPLGVSESGPRELRAVARGGRLRSGLVGGADVGLDGGGGPAPE